MFRALFYLLIFTIAISVIKSVLGIITNALNPKQNPQGAPKGSRSSAPVAGALRKDPVCGTFVSTGTSFQKKVGGETYYFCSPECRDKYTG